MATRACVQPLVEIISSHVGAVFSLFALAILFFALIVASKAFSSVEVTPIPGCVRIGLRQKNRRERRNVERQRISEPECKPSPTVRAVYIYPVKSCRGIELQEAKVSSTGLLYDRLFSFARLSSSEQDGTRKWRFITQREVPKLSLLTTELWVPDSKQSRNVSRRYRWSARARDGDGDFSFAAQGGCLVIRFPYEHRSTLFGAWTEIVSFQLPLQPTKQRALAKCYTVEDLSIWLDQPRSINMTNEINPQTLQKLKTFLGVRAAPLALFRADETCLRRISRSLPRDKPRSEFRVGFADAFPVHLMNVASISAVERDLPRSSADGVTSLDILRFRANLYVSDTPAFREDEWMRIAIGRSSSSPELPAPLEYHVACRTARCTVVNVDPESGVGDRREPHGTLKRTRQVDEGAKPHPCLGLSVIPLFQHGIVCVGDRISVLETGEHFYEKMFG